MAIRDLHAVVILYLTLTLADFRVKADVTFEDTATNVSVVVGNTAVLPCIVNGLGTKTVVWVNMKTSMPYSVGRTIFTSDERFTLASSSSENDWTVLLTDVRPTDQGVFRCMASTITKLYRDIDLSVLTPPKIRGSANETDTVNEGATVELACNGEGIPQPTVTWYEGDRVINTNNGGTSETLLIPNITVPLDGKVYWEFRCVLDNGAPPVAIKHFKVNILSVPNLQLISRSNTAVSPGSDAILSLRCTANPPPFVIWSFNGNQLNEFDRRYKIDSQGRSIYSLTITGVTEEDFGFYTVECTNIYNTASTVFQVKKLTAPDIDLTRSSGNQTVYLGDSLNISCYSSSEDARFAWFSAGLKVASGNTLSIPSVKASDAGLYICMTGNVIGYTTHRITITVQARPVLDTTPIKITAKRGFSVTLPCSIQNLGTTRVMWMSQYNVAITLDDRIILPDNRYSLAREYDKDWGLVINNVKSSDEGVYKCVVSSYPILEKEVSLIVLVSPTIDNQMTSNNMAVSEFDDVTLRCHVSGNPTPEITWYRRVIGSDHQSLARERLQHTGNILNIPQITRHSAGEYICHASNGIEPSASKNITVDVLYAPEIETMMRNMGQYIGRDSTLECTAEGSPTPDMKWYIHGQRIADSWKFKVTNYVEPLDGVVTSALLIRNIDRMDYRVYTCEAENAHGTAEHNITVFALGAPEVIIDQSSRNMVVREGTEVDLECFASGTPLPTVTWSKDDGQTEIGPGTVTLTNIQGSDAGMYTCFAENPLGSDTLSIQIDVEYPPTVSVSPQDYQYMLGEMVTINCTVRGHPQPQMSWRKDDSSENSNFDILEVDESTWIMALRIDSITSEDFGIYLCEAVNSANSSSSSVQITEIVVTDPPTEAPTTTTTMSPTTAKPTTTTTTTEPTTTMKEDNVHNPAEEIKATTPKANSQGTDSPLKDPNSSTSLRATLTPVILIFVTITLFW